MDPKKFKKLNKPAVCTVDPLEALIPIEIRYETMLKIKQESIEKYGEDLTGDCKNRLVCFGKECIGRPLTITPSSAPYIEQLAKTQKVENGKLYISTTCTGCPIFSSCSSVCNQISDYVERDRKIEPNPIFKSLSDNIPIITEIVSSEPLLPFVGEIPWTCLTELKQQVIKMYLYEQKDFNHIAQILNLENQAQAKLIFYSALTKLSRVAIMRKAIKEHSNDSYVLNAVYFDNLTITKAAEAKGISKQAARQEIKRFIEKYNIRWKKFVYKRKDKLIYNVPMLLK